MTSGRVVLERYPGAVAVPASSGYPVRPCFQLANPRLATARIGGENHIVIGANRFVSALVVGRLHRSIKLGESPWRWQRS